MPRQKTRSEWNRRVDREEEWREAIYRGPRGELFARDRYGALRAFDEHEQRWRAPHASELRAYVQARKARLKRTHMGLTR